MNTCVLCLSRRNAFECTIRSRSRWNAVLSGWGSSSRSLPLLWAESTARSDRVRRSTSSMRSLGVAISSPAPKLARPSDRNAGWGLVTAEDPVVEVGEGLADVAGEPGSLALGGGVPRGGRVGVDPQVARHLLDPEVVPRVGHE